MDASWEQRIAEFWRTADDSDSAATLQAMQDLVAGRDDPDAVYEWASVHDFLGREADAVPLYRRALDAGLRPPRRQQAIVQLGSSLRNIGRPDEAVALLSAQQPDDVVGDAARAFLALALHDSGRTEEALRVALRALAATLPLYGRAVSAYADELPTGALPARD
ncbi:tetratricopeptide repeat protein [Actinoplanes sp. NPDC023714]|uniref:tetratricopeptide repeat protein n=1 Tax=Actinoplanes sp. NPDC023714 TaxID=3154322 RepID=UPI0033FA7864